MTDNATKERFFKAIEYAEMQLPGLPKTESGVTRKAKKDH